VAGEQTYRVPSLRLPDPRQRQTVESLAQFDAVSLFTERARATHPAFAVTDRNAPAVAQVCCHLDGIPLAIELAAARVRSLSVEEVNARLDNRFRLLTGGARTALPRHQTLRALIDWSYDLLADQERALLDRLSVFADGWTLSAAEAVCAGAGVEDWEVLDLLTALADKSLVVAEAEAGGTRYRLLETIRQYAGERLRAGSTEGEVQDAHLAWCAALAQEAEARLKGPDQGAWMDRLEADLENLRAALAWGVSRRPETALRVASALTRFWVFRGHAAEGRAALAAALSAAAIPEALRVRARQEAGALAHAQGDHAAARPLLEQALHGSRALGDRAAEASALGQLGELTMNEGDMASAQVYLEEALSLNVTLGNAYGEAENLGALGYIARERGDYASSRILLERGMRIFVGHGDALMAAAHRGSLAFAVLAQGEVASADALFRETLADYRRLGSRPGQAWALASLAQIDRENGDIPQAIRHLEEALAINRDIGSRAGEAWNLETIAALRAMAG
jgi:predicted ATPase